MPRVGWSEEPALSGQRIEESLPWPHQGHGSPAAGSAERRLGTELCTAVTIRVQCVPTKSSSPSGAGCDGRVCRGLCREGLLLWRWGCSPSQEPPAAAVFPVFSPRMLQYSQFLAARESCYGEAAEKKQFLRKQLRHRLTAAKGRQPVAFPGHSAALCSTAVFHTPLTTGLSCTEPCTCPACSPSGQRTHRFPWHGSPGLSFIGISGSCGFAMGKSRENTEDTEKCFR